MCGNLLETEMAAKDIYHEIVRIALQKEGWIITDDPYYIRADLLGLFDAKLQVDLGAEQILAAEKGKQKIAIEIKSLLGPSLIYDFHGLVGQHSNYQVCMEEQEKDRILFVAIPQNAYNYLSQQRLFHKIVAKHAINLIIFEPQQMLITEWICTSEL